MDLAIVVAVAENGVIGRTDGTIPWRIKSDMIHFKKLTIGHPVIVGRKTFETFRRPLPGRLNIVVSRDHNYSVPEGCELATSAEEAVDIARRYDDTLASVIGGATIYEALMPRCIRAHVTRVHATPSGDVTFSLDENEWIMATGEEHPADLLKENEAAFTFATYERRF